MRTIFLVRHGIAADARPGMRDAERPLTKEGVERMEAAARGWTRVWDAPAAIVTSPLRRARETGEILQRAFEIDGEPHECTALAPGGSGSDLLAFVSALDSGGDVACVGHMPDLVRLLAELAGAESGIGAEFGKGTVVAIEFVGALRTGSGSLRAMIPNRALRGLA